MDLIKNIKIDLQRAFCNKLFLIGLVAAQGVFYLNIPWDNLGSLSVIYFVNLLIFGSFVQMLLICGAIPYSTSYLSDWQSGYIKAIVIRTDLRSYLRSKVVVTAFSGFVTVALGKLIFVLTMRIFVPVVSEGRHELSSQYALEHLAASHPYAYLAADAALYAMAAAAFAVLALLISSLTRNVFVTLASPMVMYFMMTSLHTILSLPTAIYLPLLLQGYVPAYLDNLVLSLLYVFAFWIGMSLLLGKLFIVHAERRFRHG